MITTLTLKLPANLKRRIALAARQKGQSANCWMVAALVHEIERKERLRVYVKQARYAAPEAGPVEQLESRDRVRFWLYQLAAGKSAARMHDRVR